MIFISPPFGNYINLPNTIPIRGSFTLKEIEVNCKEFADGKVFPNMDKVEDNYLVLPLHTKMTLADVKKVCKVIKLGW